MKITELLNKINKLKNSRINFKGINRTQIINITNDGWIQILRPETKKFCESNAWIEINDWEKTKESINALLNKEI